MALSIRTRVQTRVQSLNARDATRKQRGRQLALELALSHPRAGRPADPSDSIRTCRVRGGRPVLVARAASWRATVPAAAPTRSGPALHAN
jgi:hypothetical protein